MVVMPEDRWAAILDLLERARVPGLSIAPVGTGGPGG